MLSIFDCLLDSLENFAIVWQVERLEHEWERRVVPANPPHRRLQIVESLGLNRGGQLGSKAASDGRFVCDDALACLFDRVDDGLPVPGHDRPQINDFAGDTHIFGAFDSHSHLSQLHSVAYYCDIGAFAHDFGLAERDLVVLDRHVLLGDAIEDLRLEEKARVVASNAGQKKSFGLDWRAGYGHYEAWRVGKIRLRALAMV